MEKIYDNTGPDSYTEEYLNLIGKTKKHGYIEDLITSNMTPSQVQTYLEFLKLKGDAAASDKKRQDAIEKEFQKLKNKKV